MTYCICKRINNIKLFRLPAAVNAHLLNLSCLRIHWQNNNSFHRAIALLSSVFGQLSYLSLKTEAYTCISDPLIITGDTIQQLCIDRLNTLAKYNLNLSFYIRNDFEEKIIFNSFFKVPFAHQHEPKVFILECSNYAYGSNYHCFMVYTSPYNKTILSTELLSTNSQMYVENI